MISATATKMSASAPAFRPVVKADGPRLISGGPVLLFDVLAQDGDRCTACRPGEVRPGPQPARFPVVPSQFGEFPAAAAGRTRRGGSSPAGTGRLSAGISPAGGRGAVRCTRDAGTW